MSHAANEPFSFLKLSRGQRTYLVDFASGDDPKDICERVHNERTNEPGIKLDTVGFWRDTNPMFAKAEQEIRKDPLWATRNIVVPMSIARVAKADLDNLQSDTPYRMNGKRVEVLMQMGGMLNQDQPTSSQALTIILQSMPSLVNPLLVPQAADEHSLQTAGPQKALPAPNAFFEGEEPAT